MFHEDIEMIQTTGFADDHFIEHEFYGLFGFF